MARTRTAPVDANGREIHGDIFYTCVGGFVAEVASGVEVGARTDQQYLGSDPAVQARPDLFVRLGASPPVQIVDLPEEPRLRARDAAIATVRFRAGDLRRGASWLIEPGAWWPKDHPFVRQYAENFRRPTAAEIAADEARY